VSPFFFFGSVVPFFGTELVSCQFTRLPPLLLFSVVELLKKHNASSGYLYYGFLIGLIHAPGLANCTGFREVIFFFFVELVFLYGIRGRFFESVCFLSFLFGSVPFEA